MPLTKQLRRGEKIGSTSDDRCQYLRALEKKRELDQGEAP